ncbi:kynureninase [Marinococcus sp. PL1-022]|uniref:kynureninase n=1 Tax=Marinococcus sp. PL1-022 TaxID=3095363 RepID=UPI0029C28453|nr:kynureninase [Marinococcus sp. PL1-022]MDX6154258.1 kynureninase [Marinococcus sp. PL1-022]
MNIENIHTKTYAKKLDEGDELQKYRREFYMGETIYLDGNSLGLLSERAEKSVQEIMDMWKQLGIEGWTNGSHPWYYLSEKLAQASAPLLGAKETEVIVTGSTTVNIHQMLATFYQPTAKRYKILADDAAFPTDIYALKSQLDLRGLGEEALALVPNRDGMLDEEEIIERMSDDTALLFLPGVLYRSGQVLDMERLTKEAHARGIMVGLDLCHSVGSVPHELHEWGVDFAVWCNYKHLNGGPGAVAGLYVHEKHFGESPGLAGWFSSKKAVQFDMKHTLEPEESAGAYEIGTPHVLSMAPLIGSLEMFGEAGIERIRAKSLRLTGYMIDLIDAGIGIGLKVVSPRDPAARGGHVLLKHEYAAGICNALKAEGVVPDFRAPAYIRIAPVALYNTYEEVRMAVETLKRIIDNEEYLQFSNERGTIA